MQKSITVHCGKCNRQWEAPIRLPLPISRAVEVMKGIVAQGCTCGAYGKDILCGPAKQARA